MTDVFLNEIFAGEVENPEQFVKTIREKRREGNGMPYEEVSPFQCDR